jgi:hypothetical protein
MPMPFRLPPMVVADRARVPLGRLLVPHGGGIVHVRGLQMPLGGLPMRIRGMLQRPDRGIGGLLNVRRGDRFAGPQPR